MNERQFLRKINSRQNAYGDLCYDVVMELLEQNEKALSKPNKAINKIFKIFRINKNSKAPEQIIEDNFETVLNNTSDTAIGRLLNLLLDDDKTRNIILRNLNKVLRRFKTSKSQDKDIVDYELSSQRSRIISRIAETPEGRSVLNKNINIILEETNGRYLINILKNLKGISKEGNDKINDYLQQNKEKLIRAMIDKSTRSFSKKYNSLYTNYTEDGRRIIGK